MMQDKIKFICIVFLVLLSQQSIVHAQEYDWIIGLSYDAISLDINSLQENSETTSLDDARSFNPGVLARSQFNQLGSFMDVRAGYYMEYGLDVVSLKQGEVFDAYNTFSYIDPGATISGLYAHLHPVLAIKSGAVTLGMGLGLTLVNVSGEYMVEWWSREPTIESLDWQEVSFTTRLFIEAENKYLIWGMRLHDISSDDALYDYDMDFFTLYIGYKFD